MPDRASIAGEERARVFRDERVMAVAELAGDADQPLLREDALDFDPPDHPERIGDALLGAAAGEGRRSRLEQPDVIVGEIRLEQLGRRTSREQRRRRERLDARRRALPGGAVGRGGPGKTLEE